MAVLSSFAPLAILSCVLVIGIIVSGAEARPRAFFVFGDSLVDNGNNNYLATTARADAPPYGIDYAPSHRPTGRFSNGYNIPDLISQKLGAESTLPYLSPELRGNKLLVGANFASAGIGILNDTGIQFVNVIRMYRQLEYFQEYQNRVSGIIGASQAKSLVNQALVLITVGGNDFVNNYYLVPNSARSRQYPLPQYVTYLISEYQKLLQKLYDLGARRVLVTGTGPLGCVPGDSNPDQTGSGSFSIDDSDLSLKKLDEYQSQLQELQREKSERLHKVLEYVSTVHDLCAVLGMDFFSIVTEVHPSLNDAVGVHSKSISNGTLAKLANTVSALKEDKKQRLHKLQELASQLIDLWNLMDTPTEERRLFDHVTCNISASVDEVTVPGALALDLIEQAEVEVERLDQLKASKMKEIAFKKQDELEEIYARAHVEINPEAARGNILSLIDSGNIEPSELLTDMDKQIAAAKEEALSRKEILDKVEKWMSACEEESWLEDYNRDENRYNASRGAHINLKRAEKARILVSKIPALVDTLVAKTRTWEEVHNMSFTYDGVPLLAMLDEYAMLRHERQEEKRRMRDQKKYYEQQTTDQESVFGSRPSPARPLGNKKVVGPRPNGTPNRRLSLNAHQNGSRSTAKDRKRDNTRPVAPLNYVSMSKEDAASHVSGTEPVPTSP